jgi:crotonobetainyl-CoA:carnitine CoA-transferase CaiB-like acyl-CoA transferase
VALEHITVLDLTHMLSGPYGTLLLTDLGARTVKVEPPGAAKGRASCWRAKPTIHATAWARIS